jgi:isoamylase
VYVAFNTSHMPKALQLPAWNGRSWQLVADSSRLAPYDILVADDQLSEEAAMEARLASSMWTGSGFMSLMPWACCVLESVPESMNTALHARQAVEYTTGDVLGGFGPAYGSAESSMDDDEVVEYASTYPASSYMSGATGGGAYDSGATGGGAYDAYGECGDCCIAAGVQAACLLPSCCLQCCKKTHLHLQEGCVLLCSWADDCTHPPLTRPPLLCAC